MAETYMITAKTVEEAIAIANREYADETHEISYEIIDMPKKGFLGIGAKDAKIKVTVTKNVSLDSIVSDLRSLKVFTDKGDSGEKKNEKSHNNQQKKQNNERSDKQNSQKQNNQQKNDKQQKNNTNKSDRPQKNENKSAQPQQKKNDGVKNEKALKPEQKKPEAAAKNAPEKVGEKKEDKRSSLNNQGKPQRRQPQKHFDESNIEGSAVAVSAPMGLSDFVPSENKSSFGSSSDESKPAARMSNDIRKAKKNQPKKQQISQKNEKIIYEDRKSMITRYDVAESDDDYRKLDGLEDREMTIDEIRESVKLQASDERAEKLDEVIESITSSPVQKTRREAVSEAEMTFALEFANTLLKNMGLEATAVGAECPEDEEFDVTENCTVYPKINIIGDDTGILIGHHGETLDAIQYLVNLSAIRRSKQKDGDYVKIVVDIENYREKREETLRALARRMAARAVKYKRNVFLEPMNAYERRIIHSELQSVENVSTHSVGTDRDRKIIITYEGADKAPENKNRRRRGNGKNHGSTANNVKAASESDGAAKEKSNENGANRERRRPKKAQKMPIEKIGDILPDSDTAESEE